MTGLLDPVWHWTERVGSQDQDMESLEPLVTVEELATYLGVPVATIYAWRYRREGPPPGSASVGTSGSDGVTSRIGSPTNATLCKPPRR